jgi:hypothetical protein
VREALRLLAGALLALTVAPAWAAPGDPAAALPGPDALAPLRRAGAVQTHTPETLWERIDGEAELYRAYGLVASAHAPFEHPADADRRVEVSVFATKDALGAFGLFAAFRPGSCPEAGIGSGSCLGDYQGFFWQGARFVLADAAGPDATRPADLRRALEAVAAALGPAPARPALLEGFGRLVGDAGLRLQPEHLLGRAALPPGLEGVAGGVTYFVSTVPCDPEAVLAAYRGVLGGAVRRERDGRAVLEGLDPELGPVTLAAGRQAVAGARAAAGAPGVWQAITAILDAVAGPAAGAPP